MNIVSYRRESKSRGSAWKCVSHVVQTPTSCISQSKQTKPGISILEIIVLCLVFFWLLSQNMLQSLADSEIRLQFLLPAMSFIIWKSRLCTSPGKHNRVNPVGSMGRKEMSLLHPFTPPILTLTMDA